MNERVSPAKAQSRKEEKGITLRLCAFAGESC
jgi:hypothetical protein